MNWQILAGMDWLSIIGIFAAALIVGIMLGFLPSGPRRRLRALNRLTDRELNKPGAVS